jgi:Flp pilus assembly protein protease CpaA
VHTAVLSTSITILAIIAYVDVRARRIPNVLASSIAALGLVRMILDLDLMAAIHTMEASAAAFAAAVVLFWRGMLGGGDAKLIAVTALLIGNHNLVDFLFLMSVCGGALALAILARDELHPQRSYCSRSAGAAPAPAADRIATMRSCLMPSRSLAPRQLY